MNLENAGSVSYWLLIDSAPTGPFLISQVHERLASGKVSWQTNACLVGAAEWVPLLRAPGIGPYAPKGPGRKTPISAKPIQAERTTALGREQVAPTEFVEVMSESSEIGGIDISHFPTDHSPLVRLLRGLIISDISLGVAVVLLQLLGEILMPDKNIAAGPSPADGIFCVALLLIVPGIIVAWIGLWRLRNWGRWLYFGVQVFGHFLSIAGGLFDFSEKWGLPEAVSGINANIAGIILGLVFLSPLGSVFRKNAN